MASRLLYSLLGYISFDKAIGLTSFESAIGDSAVGTADVPRPG
jgi:hypothetical protein